MAKDRGRHTRRGAGRKGVDTEGAPGTVRGRAGTAGTEGENVPRADRAARGGRGAGRAATGDLPAEQVAAEDANEGEGLSGAGLEASGALPGSVGGTTGVAGENAGIRSPGAGVPGFPGISPDEAERLKRRRE